MTKAQKLKLCDRTLAILLPVVLTSGIWLEACSSEGFLPVVLHVCVALPFMCLIIWHIYLHFHWTKWLSKFRKLKVPTRILWWLYLLTFVSGAATLIHWSIAAEHGPLGGIHGKIGFLMIAFAIAHTLKRRKYFKKKK